MKVERRFLNQELLHDAREAFDILDSESVRSIDLRDLRVALRALGWDSSKEEGRRIIHDIELKQSDGVPKQRIIDGMIAFSTRISRVSPTGRLSYEAFCEILEYKLNESGHLDLIIASYDEFKGENGQIGLRDLHRIAQSIGEDITTDELKQMIEEADEDGDGFVSRDEFIKLLSD